MKMYTPEQQETIRLARKTIKEEYGFDLSIIEQGRLKQLALFSIDNVIKLDFPDLPEIKLAAHNAVFSFFYIYYGVDPKEFDKPMELEKLIAYLQLAQNVCHRP